MRIVVASTEAFPDGPGAIVRWIDLQARGFSHLGHDVHVVLTKGTWEGGSSTQIEGFKASRFEKCPSQTRGLLRRLQWLKSHLLWCGYLIFLGVTRRIDAIVMFSRSTEAAVIFPVVRLFGCKPCCMITDSHHKYDRMPLKTKIYWVVIKICERISSRAASLNVVVSDVLEKRFRRIAPRTPVLRLRAPADAELFGTGIGSRARAKHGLGDSKLVVYAGGVDTLEGIDVLIKAFVQVKKHHPHAFLLVAGTMRRRDNVQGTRVDFPAIAKECGVADDFLMTGHLPRPEVIDVLAAADVLVLPKIDHFLNHAATPTKIGEYLASGRPVVSSRICDLDSVLTHEKDVLFCEPGNVDDLAHSIRRVLEDDQLGRKLGKNGKIVAGQVFDYRVWTARVAAGLAGAKPTAEICQCPQ